MHIRRGIAHVCLLIHQEGNTALHLSFAREADAISGRLLTDEKIDLSIQNFVRAHTVYKLRTCRWRYFTLPRCCNGERHLMVGEQKGETVLHTAVASEKPEWVGKLLKHNANPNATDKVRSASF